MDRVEVTITGPVSIVGAAPPNRPEMALSDLSYGVHSARRSTFTPDQIERLKALRDDLTTIIEREER
jgi:hypothetical protein